MIDFKLVKGSRNDKGVVTLEVEVGGVSQVWKYIDTRGSLVWGPTPYCLILGELKPDRFDAMPEKRGPFYLLDEYESDSLSFEDFFSRFTDSLGLLCADDIYADLKEKDYVDIFYSYRDRMRLNHLSLTQAPFSEDFRAGMSQLLDAVNMGLIRIPETSLVWNQLQTFNPKDIAENPEKKFHRLRALAFGVCAYLKYGRRALLLSGKVPVYGPDSWML
jgi:hypothetical protein